MPQSCGRSGGPAHRWPGRTVQGHGWLVGIGTVEAGCMGGGEQGYLHRFVGHVALVVSLYNICEAEFAFQAAPAVLGFWVGRYPVTCPAAAAMGVYVLVGAA